MKEFYRFELERMQSVWENVVDFDLSESGIMPVTLAELLEGVAFVEDLLSVKLNYAQTNGTEDLREKIASLYNGACAENVLVTVGCAEANFLAMHTLVEPGDEVVVMMPNYMQIWGISQNRSINARPFHLREEDNWAPDLDELAGQVTDKTKLIAVCNPNNPTGYILKPEEMDEIVRIADSVGAWILSDEVYSGTELVTDEQTPSFFGKYEKVVATNSLSKTYGLPGLRIGWAVAPEAIAGELWARHDYTTIGTTMLGNTLGALALGDKVRSRLVKRGRDLVRGGLSVLESWMAEQGDVFRMVSPMASPIAFARYNLQIGSIELVERLIQQKSVLVVAGAHFGMEGFLRFRHGLPGEYLLEGLARIGELIEEIKAVR